MGQLNCLMNGLWRQWISDSRGPWLWRPLNWRVNSSTLLCFNGQAGGGGEQQAFLPRNRNGRGQSYNEASESSIMPLQCDNGAINVFRLFLFFFPMTMGGQSWTVRKTPVGRIDYRQTSFEWLLAVSVQAGPSMLLNSYLYCCRGGSGRTRRFRFSPSIR